ncbi:MAG: DUF3556 domain-containing protein [Deltaproteobacteria bacterium]
METISQSEDAIFDPAQWAKKNFAERTRIASREYIHKGLAYPLVAYIFAATKIGLLFAGWVFFCGFTPGIGGWSDISSWAFAPIAFQKAFLWSLCFETLGFGCMSGPLGLKVWPPFTAFVHYLWPGTTKLPLFPGVPLIGGTRRTLLDVALYAAFVVAILHALVQPELRAEHFLPIVVLLPLCALGDRMIFLTARGEHHFAMIVCFFLAGEWIAASKWVQLAIWFWAGVSKLTVGFAYVVPIMTANNPLLKSAWFRTRLFRSYPDDLSPSLMGKIMAHIGAMLEFGAPLVLVWVTHDGPLLWLGLGLAVALHGFIISNMPAGAVFEWNILSLYAGFFLFYFHPEITVLEVGSLPMTIYLLIGCLVLPLLGNLVPRSVSFLLSMRYYAGNWAWNAWLFEGKSYEKLNRLKRASALLKEQQLRFLSPEQATEADGLFSAFRCLHLQGRVLGKLLPVATGGRPFQDFTYADGETVAASVLGWNFGEGHQADERLLAAVQEQCGFEEGELRVICVEAQPIQTPSLHWRINDAKTGQIAEGHVGLDELARRMPWDYGEAGDVEPPWTAPDSPDKATG